MLEGIATSLEMAKARRREPESVASGVDVAKMKEKGVAIGGLAFRPKTT